MIFNAMRAALLLLSVFGIAGSSAHAQTDEHAVTIGSPEASISIEIYYSYACPHCLGLLTETREAVDGAVTAGDLQIRYNEIPRFYARGREGFEGKREVADQRSMFVSLVMQCFYQMGTPEAFNRAQTALPGILEGLAGTTRDLSPQSAPSDHADWQYWIWSDGIGDAGTTIAQPLINAAGVDVRTCDQNLVSETFNNRLNSLHEQKRQTVPQLSINGQLVPSGADQFERIQTILANVETLSTIVQAEIDFESMRVKSHRILDGTVITHVDDVLLKQVHLNAQGEDYRLVFGPDETRVTNRGSVRARYLAAPLMDFLFFRTGASEIKTIEASQFGDDPLIRLTDRSGNALMIGMRGDKIVSLSYDAVEDFGFDFVMEPQ